jgi:hypothetical protein
MELLFWPIVAPLILVLLSLLADTVQALQKLIKLKVKAAVSSSSASRNSAKAAASPPSSIDSPSSRTRS